ncbi:MAG: hypothetical protein OHK0017_02700 [Patescibacteria group bacterium]
MNFLKTKPIQECSFLTPKQRQVFMDSGWNTLGDIILWAPTQLKEVIPFTNTLVPGLKYQAVFKLDSFVNRRSQRGLSYTLLKLSSEAGVFQGFCFSRAKFIQGIIRTSSYLKCEFSTVSNFSEWNKGIVVHKLSSAKNTDEQIDSKIELIYPKFNSKIDSKFLRAVHARIKPEEYVFNLNGLVKTEILNPNFDLYKLHHPNNQNELEQSNKELIKLKVYLNTALQKYISILNTQHKQALSPTLDLKWMQSSVKKLPFELTKSQKGAIWEILKDVTVGWESAE